MHDERPSDPGSDLRLRRRGVILAVCATVSVGLWTASRSTDFVEHTYAEDIGPAIARTLGAVSGLVPFSVAELLVFGVPLYLAWLFGRAVLRVISGRRPLIPTLLNGLLRSLVLCAVVGTLFYALWGVQYARVAIDHRLRWNEGPSKLATPPMNDLLESLCVELVDEVNELVKEGADAFSSGAIAPDLDAIDTGLDEAFRRVTASLDLHPSFADPRGPAKPIVSSALMNRLGLTGFYFPWTGEANFNDLAPLWQRVHAIAHEKSHQRGIMSEDEANFFGFVACIAANDPFVRYCGYLFAQRHLLGQLGRSDPTRARELIARRHPDVQRDVDEARTFWRGHRGWAMKAATKVNDRYLKAHEVKGGVASYGRVTRLLVLFARTRSGTLLWTR